MKSQHLASVLFVSLSLSGGAALCDEAAKPGARQEARPAAKPDAKAEGKADAKQEGDAHPGHHGGMACKGPCEHHQAGAGGGPTSFDKQPAIGTKASCPVSGEAFVVKKKTVSTTYKSRVYAFCCPDCKQDFEKDPEKYATKK